MSQQIFSLNRKPDSPITKEVRDGWREKIQELLSALIEQCEEIQGECEVALSGMSFYVDDDGESEYCDVEFAKEISRDELHAISLQGMIESQLECLDDLFSGSTSGYYSFPDDS